MTVVVDATVLVYAVGDEHPLRNPCRVLLQLVGDGSLRATTTVEVLQEFAHVRARRRDRTNASQLASQYADLFGPLLEVRETHLRRGLELWCSHSELGCFDAVLAAVAQSSGSGILVSGDSGFAAVPDIDHVMPDAEGITRLLGD